jgi:hypothetical protein
VFISYRRADSGGWARSLHDGLEQRLGRGRSFRDVAMEGGIDFRQHVDRVLDRCDVLLAVIGQRWTSIGDAEGNRRLDEPDDLVRREIARALERPDVQVIPVLVDGAEMPKENELPPELTSLSRRNACKLVDERWEYDVDRLTKRLRDLLGDERPVTWPARAGWAMAGAAALAALVSAPLTEPLRGARSEIDIDRSAAVGDRISSAAERLGFFAVERGVMWGLVVAAALIAALLVLRRGGPRRSVSGPVVLGLGVGVLAGAIGAALYIGIKDSPSTAPEEWLLQPVLVGATGVLVGASFARLVSGARPAECRLAGLAGGLVAGALTPVMFDDPRELARAGVLAMQAVLVVGAVGAVLAAAAERRADESDRASAPVRPPVVR